VIKFTFYCDGCGITMSQEDASSTPRSEERSNTEIFCVVCRNWADSYWKEKSSVVDEAIKEFTQKLERHRRSYFQRAKKLKAV